MEWERVVLEFVRERLSGEGGHDYEHTLRVYSLCMKLAELEGGVDIQVLKAASLLHDVARPLEHKLGVSHATKSAEIAKEILEGTDFPGGKIEKVCRVIRSHRFTEGVEPQDLEGKILQDADRLDAIGAIGIARAFMFGGKTGRSLDESVRHFHEKLLKLRDEMHTESAYRISVKRHEFMEKFLDRLEKEIRGEM